MSTSFNPRNRSAGDAGVNISGAQYLRHVLFLLGYTDTGISGVGCGPRIKAATAREWGRAILTAIGNGSLRERRVPDPGYAGGFREEPYLSSPTLERLPSLEEHFFNPQAKPSKEPEDLMSPPSKEWLTELANFFVQCGGFTQS